MSKKSEQRKRQRAQEQQSTPAHDLAAARLVKKSEPL